MATLPIAAGGRAQLPLPVAAPTEAASPKPAAETPEEILERLATTSHEVLEQFEALSGNDGSERLAALREFDRLTTTENGDFVSALDQVQRRRKSGIDVRSLVERGRQLLRRASRIRRRAISAVESTIDTDAARRETLAPAELLRFEYDLAERSTLLSDLYRSLIDLSRTMGEAGMDVAAEKLFLERGLSRRAATLTADTRAARERLDSAEFRGAEASADGERQALALLVEERGDASATNLLSTLQMLESLEVDTSELAAGADELTAQVAPPAADAEAEAIGLRLRRWLLEARDALHTRLPLFLKRLAVALGIFALFWVLARFARRLTSGVLQRTRLSSSTILRDMIVRTTGRLILFAGVLIVLWQFGFGSAPVLAGVGIAGVAISFALQDILANFAAGGMILAYRPYDVGDVVEAAGVTGKVQNMNVVSTRILTFDHQTLIVPNGKIWGDVIRNVTVEPIRRVDLEFGIAYEDDVTRAERLFAEIVAGHEKVLDDPAPVIKLHRLGESSVDFIVRPWAKTEDYWDVYWDVTREVKMRFDQDGLSFPYPQRDVHLIGAPAAEESAGPDEGAGDSEPS